VGVLRVHADQVETLRRCSLKAAWFDYHYHLSKIGSAVRLIVVLALADTASCWTIEGSLLFVYIARTNTIVCLRPE